MSGMAACSRANVGAVAQECSPAWSIWCSSSPLRTGRTEHSSKGRSWSGVHMPLLARGGGVATGVGVCCPARQTEQAHDRRPNFSGTSSAIGIWAVCRTACTSLGSAQKAATTSRLRRRSHDGRRWGAKNWLMGL